MSVVFNFSLQDLTGWFWRSARRDSNDARYAEIEKPRT